MKTRKNIMIMLLVVLVLSTVLAVSGWSRTAYAVDIKSKEGVGSYLVDSRGRTLYNLKTDSQGKSTCTGECAVMWQEFYAEKITVPAGLSVSNFGSITRDDGKKQTTYKGMPLYYFTGDKEAGDTNGNGVHDIWIPVTPSESAW